MPRCVPRLAVAVLALAGAAGCAVADDAAPPATAAAGTGPAAPSIGDAGAFVPTTVGSVDKASLPPALRRVDALAGGDPAEETCIDAGLAAALGQRPELAGRADAHAGIAGTAAVQCLPPAKLAAALTDRLRSPGLGLALSDDQLACARTTLVGAAGSPVYTVFVGGLAMEDPVAVRQGAVDLDAACGTGLAAAGD
jgi:hypothetical protein